MRSSMAHDLLGKLNPRAWIVNREQRKIEEARIQERRFPMAHPWKVDPRLLDVPPPGVVQIGDLYLVHDEPNHTIPAAAQTPPATPRPDPPSCPICATQFTVTPSGEKRCLCSGIRNSC